MSESSEDKSKRSYLKLLENYEWNIQYSIFYDEIEHSTSLLEDMIRFKQTLRRKCPNQPFLTRIQLLNRRSHHNPAGGTQAYLTILTTRDTHREIQESTEDSMNAHCNITSRKLSPAKINSMARAIKNQKPHRLTDFFKKEKVNRYSLLNREQLLEKTTQQQT